MKQVETRAYDSQMDDPGDGLLLSGYASVFNRHSEFLGWIEIIEKGAFDACDMSDVIATCEHNMSQPLARTLNQTLTLSIDEVGLRYSAQMADVSYARDLSILLKGKYITKSSFGFWVDKEEWTYENDETPVRHILKISALRDVGPVVSPAYTDTSASVRSKIPQNPKKIYTGMSLDMANTIINLKSKLITTL